ncbi:hypothetical protein RB620_02750 [Paenibacillus sp. LHD-117]|nr:hypothetical protein [Paenibacillus sp. LHD-117]MDQ6418349.1 hypothetical protein [Paenibacillus sp. LHD-117]
MSRSISGSESERWSRYRRGGGVGTTVRIQIPTKKQKLFLSEEEPTG